MVALWIILGVLAFVSLVLSSPVSLSFHAETGTALQLYLRLWGVPVRLLPRPESPEETVMKSVKSETGKKKFSLLRELKTTFEEDGVAATVRWLGELTGMAKRATGRLLRAMTVKQLIIALKVSGEDAFATAMHHGETCAVLYPAVAGLTAVIKTKKTDVTVTPDFLSEGTAYVVDVTACVSLWRLAGAAIGCLWDMLRLDLLTAETQQEIPERTV